MTDVLLKRKISPQVVNKFSSLINVCFANNICVLKERKYIFLDEVTMGSPLKLSGIHLYGSLGTSWSTPLIKFWSRCVDDVFLYLAWPSVDSANLPRQDQPTPSVNSLPHGDGWPTAELSRPNYHTIRAYQNVLRPEFAIYRRTTFSGVSINRRSYHPQMSQTCSDPLPYCDPYKRRSYWRRTQSNRKHSSHYWS